MILLFILGCIVLIATCSLLLDFVMDMQHHVYTSKDVLSVIYMLLVIIFAISSLVIMYCYAENIDLYASMIDDEIKHINEYANLMNPNWC